MITAIETQGRFGMGSGKEFVPSYQVEYSRNGGLSWHKWKDLRGLNVSIVTFFHFSLAREHVPMASFAPPNLICTNSNEMRHSLRFVTQPERENCKNCLLQF